MSMAGQLQCPNCSTLLTPPVAGRVTQLTCPSCATPLELLVLPALASSAPSGRRTESVVMAGEAACFVHPAKKAVVPCDRCGKFLCALCDLEIQGQHYCPTCLEAGRGQGKIELLESRRFVRDRAALTLSLVPLLIFPAVILTAPAALVLGIQSFRRDGSLVSSGSRRAVLAIVLALIEAVAAVVIYFMVVRSS